MDDFGQRLKLARKSSGLSQTDLSDLVYQKFNVRIKVSTISNYETNAREPSLQNIKFFALVLDTPTDYFFDTMNIRLDRNDDQTPKIKLLSQLKRQLNKFEDI